MKRFKNYLFIFMLVFSLFVFAFACNKTEDPKPTPDPVVDPDPQPEPVKQAKSIAVDEDSVKAAQAKEIFDYHEIKIKVVYEDDSEETLNLSDDMFTPEELNKFTSFGNKKINITYRGAEVTLNIKLARAVLHSIYFDEESLKAAQAKDVFNYTEVKIKELFTNNTVEYLSLSSQIISSVDIANLYMKGEYQIKLTFSGKETIANVKNDKDYFVTLDTLANIPDGTIVGVKAFVTTYTANSIYAFFGNAGALLNCNSFINSAAHSAGNLDAGLQIVAVGEKVTNDGEATLKQVCGIKATGETTDVSKIVELNSVSDIQNNQYQFVTLNSSFVVSTPEVFDDRKDVVVVAKDDSGEFNLVVTGETDDTFSQKLFITLSELFPGHELVIENVLAGKYGGKLALIVTKDSKVSYISQADEYHRPEEGTINAEFDAFLNDMLLWFLGDNPFNLNYQIYDLKAFDEKYGTDLYNSQVEPSNPEDMTPEKELEGYQDYLEKKALLEAFNIEDLSYNQKIAYKVIEDQLNKTLQYFKFDDEGKNVFFYYGTQLGSYLGYQAQLPAILADYRFDDKKDIEDYLEFIKVVQKDFEALYFFEKSKCEANKGSQLSDAVIDKVIEQCENFMNKTEENYLITVFNDRIGDYDFLTPQEVEDYKKKNEEYINTYFVPAYAWLKEKLEELKGLNNDSVTGGFCKTEYGVDYYQVYFQDACGTDMTVDELVAYIEEKYAQYEKLSAVYSSYDGNLMQAAGIVKSVYDDNLAAVINYVQEKCVGDFPQLEHEYKVGVNIKINTVPEALQENSSPAYYLTSPIDAQTDELIYINPPEFSEIGNYMFQTLSHECWPGHLYQNVYFKSLDNIHDIRKVIGYSSYAEGWANYVENYVPKYVLEDYSYQQAFLLDIYSSLHFCMLDIGINCKNWKIKDIIEFYGLTEEDVRSERYTWTNGDKVSWDDFEDIYYTYCEVPTNYLKYYLSSALLLDIKAEFRQAMGVYYSEKLFHTIFLETGDVSWPILAEVYRDYAALWGTNGTMRTNN